MGVGLLIQGFIIGFLIATPVGPINVLIIRRTLMEGRLSGLLCGFGASTADTLYGSIAAFGLTSISNFLVDQQVWLRIIGGAFLCYLGVKTILERPSGKEATVQRRELAGAYASTFLLTLTNPLTILSYTAVFAGFGVVSTNYSSAVLLVLGVLCGSASLGAILVGGVSLFQSKFDSRHMRWVNRASGALIMWFGLAALLGFLH